jgi:hypothetical protein
MKEWADIIIHIAMILILLRIYDLVKNIRKVLAGEIADDTMADFAKEFFKGKKDIEKEKKKNQ